jgi:hypothetical protein
MTLIWTINDDERILKERRCLQRALLCCQQVEELVTFQAQCR